MLCLGLRQDNAIVIRHAGEELRLELLINYGGGGVRLGFDGPMTFEVVRSDAVRQEPRESREAEA